MYPGDTYSKGMHGRARGGSVHHDPGRGGTANLQGSCIARLSPANGADLSCLSAFIAPQSNQHGHPQIYMQQSGNQGVQPQQHLCGPQRGTGRGGYSSSAPRGSGRGTSGTNGQPTHFHAPQRFIGRGGWESGSRGGGRVASESQSLNRGGFRGGIGGRWHPTYGREAGNQQTAGKQQWESRMNTVSLAEDQSGLQDVGCTVASGGPTRKLNDVKVCSEDASTWTSKEYHALVKAFVADESMHEISFPPTLSASDRHEMHKAAMHYGLDHKSSGPSSSRVLTLSKITVPMKHQAATGVVSSCHIMNGQRVKTMDGYQGAQELPDEFVTEKADIVQALVQPLRQMMMKSIKYEAGREANRERTWRVGQPGLSSVPASAVNGKRFEELQAFRHGLPSMKRKADIIEAVKSNDVVIVCGDTGCGKTTQIPQMLHDAKLFPQDSIIICTQPRRISAVSVAQRVAEERGEACGSSCGYIIRFENVTSSKTRIVYMTTGILLRWLHTTAALAGIACIIVDEAHERDVETDFALLLLRDRLLQLQQNEKGSSSGARFKLLIMSATIQIDRFGKYMAAANGGKQPSVISIPGTLFPVHSYYLDDALSWLHLPPDSAPIMEMVKKGASPLPATELSKVAQSADAKEEGQKEKWTHYNKLKGAVFCESNQEPETMVPYDVVQKLIERFHRSGTNRKDGILVFLPGWAAIERVASTLRRSPIAKELSVLLLHSTLTTQEQQRVFFPPPRGFRKVVLATSIAETSITIDDIVFVIDCCLLKGTSYDPAGNTSALKASLIGKANGMQRRGRAGRCQEGVCVHLLPKAVYDVLPDFLPPQIVRTPLEEVCLQVKAIKGDERCVDVLSRALDAPPPDAIEHAVHYLKEIGALDNHETLTNVGRALAQMPIHPVLGKMLFVATCVGVLEPVATIAASLSQKSPFTKPLPHQRNAARQALQELDNNELSDHLCVLRLVKGWKSSHCSTDFAMQHFADQATLRSIDRVRQQLISLVTRGTSLLKSCNNDLTYASRHQDNMGLVRLAILWSLYPHIGTVEYRLNRDTNRANALCWDNKPAQFSAGSVLMQCKRAAFMEKTFFFYYERMLLESKLNIFEATSVTPVEVALCVGNVDILPLKDVPLPLRVDEESRLGPYAPFKEVHNPTDDATALFFDGYKKLYVTNKKAGNAIRVVRECMDYYLALSVRRINAALFPEDLVRAIGLIIGYPVAAIPPGTAIGAGQGTTTGGAEDGHNQQPERYLPAFARGGGASEGDSDDDGENGAVVTETMLEIEDLGLTEEQLKRVTAAFGELSVLRPVLRSKEIVDISDPPEVTSANRVPATQAACMAEVEAAEKPGTSNTGGEKQVSNDDSDNEDDDVVVLDCHNPVIQGF